MTKTDNKDIYNIKKKTFEINVNLNFLLFKENWK